MDLEEQLDSILNHETMPRDIVEGLGALGGVPEVEFDELVERVEGRFESSRHYPVVLQFIREHSMLREDELERLFRFIYNSLVSNFKGELAEILARPSIVAFADTLRSDRGTSLEVILGHELKAKQRGRRAGWYKWADAALVRFEGSLVEIVGLVEIKSMRRGVESVRGQVARHVARLKGGLWLRGVEIDASRIVARVGERTVPASRLRPADAGRFSWLLIRPWLTATSGDPTRHPDFENVWLAELPYPADELMEAAYRFAAWYFGRIGPKAFLAHGERPADPDDHRVPAPHAEMSLEENGTNSMMEALFGVLQRDTFREPVSGGRGRQSASEVLTRLYNTFGFGYEQAESSEIMFPEGTPNPESEARWEQWNESMDHYRAGRFVEALELHPDPETNWHLIWRHRDWLMLARLRARMGDVAGARVALRAREAIEPTSNISIPIETAGVEVLVDIADRRSAAARESFERAMARLTELQALVRTHEENGWGIPSKLDVPSAQAGVIDLAVAAVILDDPSTALALLSRLRRPSGWEKTLFEHDPVLKTLFRAPGPLDALWATISSWCGRLQCF